MRGMLDTCLVFVDLPTYLTYPNHKIPALPQKKDGGGEVRQVGLRAEERVGFH